MTIRRRYTEADCIICGKPALKLGRRTGPRYGMRFICGECGEKKTFDRAGNIIDVAKKPDLAEQVHNCLLDMQESRASNHRAQHILRQLCNILASHHREIASEVAEICSIQKSIEDDPLIFE